MNIFIVIGILQTLEYCRMRKKNLTNTITIQGGLNVLMIAVEIRKAKKGLIGQTQLQMQNVRIQQSRINGHRKIAEETTTQLCNKITYGLGRG